jgi:hypothetical protein
MNVFKICNEKQHFSVQQLAAGQTVGGSNVGGDEIFHTV